jgi:hypothetical protein
MISRGVARRLGCCSSQPAEGVFKSIDALREAFGHGVNNDRLWPKGDAQLWAFYTLERTSANAGRVVVSTEAAREAQNPIDSDYASRPYLGA